MILDCSAPVERSAFDEHEDHPSPEPAEAHHTRDTSDDAETNAMLAAAVAQMDKSELKSTPSRKGPHPLPITIAFSSSSDPLEEAIS